MSKIKNYEYAIEELKSIVEDIENDTVSVDELTKKVERASELIKYCKTTLYKTQKEVNSALDDMVDLEDSNTEN